MKKLDKNTLGDSPAAIYLIDTLNQGDNVKDRKVLKLIHSFHEIFAQLLKAHEKSIINDKVVRVFSEYKRKEIKEQSKEMLNEGYSELVINLYGNLIIAELKKFQRKAYKVKLLEKSSQDRAKSVLKNRNLKYHNQKVETYGKTGSEEVSVNVQFNEYGIAKVEFDRELIKDDITSETLMNKSVKRLKRQGKL